jgi:hypothetical protein
MMKGERIFRALRMVKIRTVKMRRLKIQGCPPTCLSDCEGFNPIFLNAVSASFGFLHRMDGI